MKKSITFILLVAICAALLCSCNFSDQISTWFSEGEGTTARSSDPDTVAYYEVLVAQTNLTKGTQITKENCEDLFSFGKTTDKNLTKSGYQYANELLGMYLQKDVAKGDIILREYISSSYSE